MELTPAFDSGTTSYTASTTNDTNMITATATKESAVVEIKNGETVVVSGSAATWTEGENIVTITVTDGLDETIYTVTVTKTV